MLCDEKQCSENEIASYVHRLDQHHIDGDHSEHRLVDNFLDKFNEARKAKSRDANNNSSRHQQQQVPAVQQPVQQQQQIRPTIEAAKKKEKTPVLTKAKLKDLNKNFSGQFMFELATVSSEKRESDVEEDSKVAVTSDDEETRREPAFQSDEFEKSQKRDDFMTNKQKAANKV